MESASANNGDAPIAADDRPTLKYRVLDPCAGDGQALFALCEPLKGQVVPHAIELDEGRGEWLRAREFNFGYGRSIINDAFDTIVESESMALLYLNPPYDSAFDVKGVRRQRTELPVTTAMHVHRPTCASLASAPAWIR